MKSDGGPPAFSGYRQISTAVPTPQLSSAHLPNIPSLSASQSSPPSLTALTHMS